MAIRMLRNIQSRNFLRWSSLPRIQTKLDIPEGHIAVYVGECEKTRLVIPVSFLNQPLFQDLLSRAEEEFGYDHPNGGLTIPCSMDVFIDVTSQLSVVCNPLFSLL